MDLFANHTECHQDGLPSRVDVRGFAQERERGLKGRCQGLRRRGGQPQTVRTDGPRSEVAELDQILWGYVEHFAATVKLRDGRSGNRVGHVSPVSQPAQYAGIDEN